MKFDYWGLLRKVVMAAAPTYLFAVSRGDVSTAAITQNGIAESTVRTGAFWLGWFTLSIGYVVWSEYCLAKRQQVDEGRKSLAKANIQLFAENLKLQYGRKRGPVGAAFKGVSVLVFVPRKDRLRRIKDTMEKYFPQIRFERWFSLLKEIGDPDDIYFEVHKDPQGLVGAAYSSGDSLQRCDLERMDNLTDLQKPLVVDWKLWICIPVTIEKDEYIYSITSPHNAALPDELIDELHVKTLLNGQELRKGMCK